MRTTLNLDIDVLDKAQFYSEKMGRPFRVIINEALREGLKKLNFFSRKKAYKTRPHKMGLKPGFSLDNIEELLSQSEGEKHL